MEKDGKAIVAQSNKLIQARWGKLTLIEKRLYLKLATTINKYDKDFKDTIFYAKDLMKEIGLGKNNYSDLKKATFNLLRRVVRIVEGSVELQSGLVSSAEYNDHKGTVSFHFDPRLKPYLLDLKERFTIYEYEIALSLKSVYSIRFYELMKEIFDKGCNKIYKLDELRKMVGVEDDEYKLYGHFKKKVILVAQTEMKSTTDICFEFHELKQGRKVDAIKFFVYSNGKKEKTKSLFKPGQITEVIRSDDQIKKDIDLVMKKMSDMEIAGEDKANKTEYHDLIAQLCDYKEELRQAKKKTND